MSKETCSHGMRACGTGRLGHTTADGVPGSVGQPDGPTVERSTVKYYDNSRGFGFIGERNRRRGLFFSIRAWTGVEPPRQGQPVRFTRAMDRDGRPCAEVVELDQEGQR